MAKINRIDISKDVKDLIDEIIAKEGLSNDAQVIYKSGSQEGDGYLSRNIAATISDGKQTLDIFMKCGLNIQPTAMMPIDRYYSNEIYFYDKVYPAFAEFLREKGIEDGFRNVPKCYGTSNTKIVALENLKIRGYELCDKTKPLKDEYVASVFRIFAKFHAISYAFKDQKPKEYEEVITPTLEPLQTDVSEAFEEQAKLGVQEFLDSLDPVEDKHLLNGTVGLAESLVRYGNTNFSDPERTDYDILTQGDCWCNNMMFLFDGGNKDIPKDIKLLDWQIIRTCIPVFDLAYFFYTCASEEAMKNLDGYLRIYHEELSHQIKKLGSDPEVVYPFSVFKQHWRKHAKFGFYMAFMLIRIMLSEKGEHLDLENTNIESSEGAASFFSKIKNNDEYFRRMKVITEHMVSNEFV